jgi:hypothetical protein
VTNSKVINILELATDINPNEDSLSDTFGRIESLLQSELSDCYELLNTQTERPSISLLESIAQIHCAIDIIHSADTPEQRNHVYSILKEIKAA